ALPSHVRTRSELHPTDRPTNGIVRATSPTTAVPFRAGARRAARAARWLQLARDTSAAVAKWELWFSFVLLPAQDLRLFKMRLHQPKGFAHPTADSLFGSSVTPPDLGAGLPHEKAGHQHLARQRW